MPPPREVFRVFTLPFLVIVGGLSALTTLIHILAGENPLIPLKLIASGSVDSLLPFAGFLLTLWLFYSIIYYLPVLYLGDLRRVSQDPDEISDISGRRGFSAAIGRAPDRFLSWPTTRPLAQSWPWPVQHILSKWVPGFSPKVEYE